MLPETTETYNDDGQPDILCGYCFEFGHRTEDCSELPADDRLAELHELRLASDNGDGRPMTVAEMQELDRLEARS